MVQANFYQGAKGVLKADWVLQAIYNGYGGIATLLTALLKKNGFKWIREAKQAFLQLKQAVMEPLS